MIACYIKDIEKRDYYIQIPYEVNHDFLMKLQWKILRWELDLPKIFVTAPDYWPWIEFSWEKLDVLLCDYEMIENNLDFIMSVVPLPEKIGLQDGYVDVWFRTNLEYENYVELWKWWFMSFLKKDLLYLIWLLKKKAREAKEKWETLCFTWD